MAAAEWRMAEQLARRLLSFSVDRPTAAVDYVRSTVDGCSSSSSSSEVSQEEHSSRAQQCIVWMDGGHRRGKRREKLMKKSQ